MNRRLQKLVVLCIAMLGAAIVGFVLLMGSQQSAATSISMIDVIDRLSAGATTTVEIIVDDTAADEVDVVVASNSSNKVVTVGLRNGRGLIDLTPPLTNAAGVISIASSDLTMRQEVAVTAEATAASVELLVSGRTLLPGQTASAHALVTDRFGNPVADGVPVEFVTRTGQQLTTRAATTRGGRASVTLDIGTTPGASIVVAAAQDMRSSAEIVTRLVDIANEIKLGIRASDVLVADGISRVRLGSDPIVDASGAPLPDGTAVSLLVKGPAGAGLVTGQLSDGRVSATMLAPERPGVLVITPRIGPVTGAPLTVTFEPAVEPFDFRATSVDGRVLVDVGPILAWHGGLVADGTPVQIGNQRLALIDGRASATVVVNEDPDVVVLGVQGVQS